MAHIPAVYINNTLDPRVLMITDVSTWQLGIPRTNVLIKINIPGSYDDFTPIFKVQGSSYYTTDTFGLSTDCLGDLPDGIYTIVLSVCPNDQVYTVYKFLRDTCTRGQILQALSTILVSCDQVFDCYGKNITSQRILELKDLLLILDIATTDVRNLKYNEAVNKLDYVNSILSTY